MTRIRGPSCHRHVKPQNNILPQGSNSKRAMASNQKVVKDGIIDIYNRQHDVC